MALRTIGTSTAVFGTGSAGILSKEITIEVATDVAEKDGTGKIVGYQVGNETITIRETKYAGATEAQTLSGDEIRKTISSSNEDFQKVTVESRDVLA